MSRRQEMDPQRLPLLEAIDGGQSRDSSWRRSDSEKLGLGSLASLEEGVAQLSSADHDPPRSGRVQDNHHNEKPANISHSFTTSASFSHPSPTSNIASYRRLPPTSQHSNGTSPTSTARTETSSASKKLSHSSLSDFFRHRTTETYLADPSVQNLASIAFGEEPSGVPSSPVGQSSTAHQQHTRKSSMPWRFLSSPIRKSEDHDLTGNAQRMPESSPIAASGLPDSSKSRRSFSEAKHRFLEGLPGARNVAANPLLEEMAVAAAVSDEGRIVAHDSGSMTLNARDDMLTRYPDDILIYMMTFLQPKDVLAISETCRVMCALASCSSIWKVFYFMKPGWYINDEPVQHQIDISLRSWATASIRSEASFDSPAMASRVAAQRFAEAPSTPAKQSLSQLLSSSASSRNSNKQTPVSPTSGATASRLIDASADTILDWRTIYKERTELERRWSHGEPSHVTLSQVHEDAVYCCYMFGNMIVTGSRDQSIKFWDHRAGSGKDPLLVHHMPKAHRLSVLCMQVDPEDIKCRGLMVTGSSDANIIVWALRGFLHTCDDDQGVDGITKRSLRNSSRLKKPKQVAVLTGHKAGVLDLFLSPDKTKIVSCSKDATIKIWNRNTLQLTHNFPFHTGPVNCLSVHPTGNQFVSASGDGTIILWDLEKCKLIKKLYNGTPGLACIAFTASGLIYFGGSDRKFNALNVETEEIAKDLQGHRDLVRTLVIKPELQRLVSGSYDQDVRIWDLKTDECVGALVDSHVGMVFCVASDATKIVSTSHDATMAVQDFSNGLKYAALFA